MLRAGTACRSHGVWPSETTPLSRGRGPSHRSDGRHSEACRTLYSDAARLAERGDPISAEDHLVSGWNDDPALLRSNLKRGETARRRGKNADGHARRLLDRRLRHHQNDAFEASVPIVLAQTGSASSLDITGARGFASPRVATLSTRPRWPDTPACCSCLRVCSSSGRGQRIRQAKLETGPAIMHGRELGYDTKPELDEILRCALRSAGMARLMPTEGSRRDPGCRTPRPSSDSNDIEACVRTA